MATNNVPGMGEISGNVLFYSRPEPLTPELHGKIGVVRSDGPFAFAKVGHAIPLTVGEFPLAAVTGPIIFVGEEKFPIAVMGLQGGENMFVTEQGLFEPGIYVPAYIRRYPFIFANDEAAQQMVLCIDRDAPFISATPDMPFFDDKGQPSEYTQNCINFCNDFEVERVRTEGFLKILKDNDLFELKTAHYTPTNPDGTPGETQQIAEYYGISEDKLNALPAEKIIEMRDNGALGQIYAHLVSLVGWDRLIAISIGRQIAAAQKAANN